MKKVVLDYLCKCEGWKTALQNIHWNADNMSQHKLCDDIAERLASFEDQVGEVEQSMSGNLPFNKLKGIEYKIKNLRKYIEDVIADTNTFYKKVKGMGENYVGMASDCESFLSDMQRNLYLVNFTMKEDFKRTYRKKINESKKSVSNNVVTLSESQLMSCINEAVHNVLERHSNNNSVNEVVSKVINEAIGEMARKKAKPKYTKKQLGTFYAVNKFTNLIVNSWDYSKGFDLEDVKAYKKDYFFNDLIEYGFNPKAYVIRNMVQLERMGLDPKNQLNNWSNTGVFPLFEENKMKRNGEDFWQIARESHPDWFVEN
jgi:hypothetical protein